MPGNQLQTMFEAWGYRRGKILLYFKKDARNKYENPTAYAEWVAFQAGFSAARNISRTAEDDVRRRDVNGNC